MNNTKSIVRPPNPPACPKLEGVFLPSFFLFSYLFFTKSLFCSCFSFLDFSNNQDYAKMLEKQIAQAYKEQEICLEKRIDTYSSIFKTLQRMTMLPEREKLFKSMKETLAIWEWRKEIEKEDDDREKLDQLIEKVDGELEKIEDLKPRLKKILNKINSFLRRIKKLFTRNNAA